MKIDIDEFWGRVNYFLKAKGKTQKQFSSDCGFQERRIESLLNGKRLPSPEECVDIAKVMNVSVDYLLTGKAAETKELTADEATILDNFRKAPTVYKHMALSVMRDFANAEDPGEPWMEVELDPNDIPEDYHPTDSEST